MERIKDIISETGSLISGTPLIRLRRIVEDGHAGIPAKIVLPDNGEKYLNVYQTYLA